MSTLPALCAVHNSKFSLSTECQGIGSGYEGVEQHEVHRPISTVTRRHEYTVGMKMTNTEVAISNRILRWQKHPVLICRSSSYRPLSNPPSS